MMKPSEAGVQHCSTLQLEAHTPAATHAVLHCPSPGICLNASTLAVPVPSIQHHIQHRTHPALAVPVPSIQHHIRHRTPPALAVPVPSIQHRTHAAEGG